VGEVLDKQALSAYRHRLAEIDADLDEARSWVDTGRAAKLAAARACPARYTNERALPSGRR
jgi:hypothetical protein